METRNVKITLETAKRLYEQGGEFKEMALSSFTEAELNPVRNEWESMFVGKKIKGYFIDHDESSIIFFDSEEDQFIDYEIRSDFKNIFKTEKQAKSALAYAQLTQLMALPEYNGDWVPDWNDDCEAKYIIKRVRNGIDTDYYSITHHHIFFKSEEIRDRFMKNNYDLLKEYFELD